MSIPTEIEIGNWSAAFDPFAYLEAHYLSPNSDLSGTPLDARNGSMFFCQPLTNGSPGTYNTAGEKNFFDASFNALGAFRSRVAGRTCGTTFDLSLGGSFGGSASDWAVKWGASGTNGNMIGFYDAIRAGTYNANIDNFISAVKASNCNHADFYIRVYHEAYGYWYPWCWLVGTQRWRDTYNYIVNRMKAAGIVCAFLAPWGGSSGVVSSSVVLNDATTLANINGLSVDVYSTNGATDPTVGADSFGAAYSFARQHTLDVYLSEFGLVNTSTDSQGLTYFQNMRSLMIANADITKRSTAYIANGGDGVVNFCSNSSGYTQSHNYYVGTLEPALWNASGGGTGSNLAIVSVQTGAGTLTITTTGALNVYLSQAGAKVAGSDKTPNSSGVTSYSGLAAGTYDIFAWDVAAGGQGSFVTTQATITAAAALQITSVTADNAGNVTIVTVGALNDVIFDATTGAKVAEHAPVANTWTFAGIPTGTYNAVAYDVAAGGSGNATAPSQFSVQNGGGVVDVPTPHGLVILNSDSTPLLTAAGVPLLT